MMTKRGLHPDKLHGVNMALAPKAYARQPGLISRLAEQIQEEPPSGPAGPEGPMSKAQRRVRRRVKRQQKRRAIKRGLDLPKQHPRHMDRA